MGGGLQYVGECTAYLEQRQDGPWTLMAEQVAGVSVRLDPVLLLYRGQLPGDAHGAVILDRDLAGRHEYGIGDWVTMRG